MQAAINMGLIWKVEYTTWRGIHTLLHRLWQYMCYFLVFVKNNILLNKLVLSIFRKKISSFNINVDLLGYRHAFLQDYSILWYIWYMGLFVITHCHRVRYVTLCHCVHWKERIIHLCKMKRKQGIFAVCFDLFH